MTPEIIGNPFVLCYSSCLFRKTFSGGNNGETINTKNSSFKLYVAIIFVELYQVKYSVSLLILFHLNMVSGIRIIIAGCDIGVQLSVHPSVSPSMSANNSCKFVSL